MWAGVRRCISLLIFQCEFDDDDDDDAENKLQCNQLITWFDNISTQICF